MPIKKIILTLAKIFALIFLISFERVVGLPLIFTLLGLIWLDQVKDNYYFYPGLLLFLSYIMAVAFSAPWSIVFFVWTLTAGLVSLNIKQVKSKNKRFFIVVILQNLFWLWWLELPVNYLTVAQFVISYLLVVMWTRMLRLKK
jgi:hypothetical protein